MTVFFFIYTILADFADVIQKTDLHSKIPFKLDGQFIQRYFGRVSKQIFCLNCPFSSL